MSEAAHHHPALAHHFEDLDGQKEASSLGMWLFIAQEVMFFGGLFLAYTVYRNLYPAAFAEASHHLDWKLGGINTAVLILSSLTMALAVRAAALGHRKQIVLFLILTVVLGSIFLGVKVVEYGDKFEHHLVPGPHFQFAGPNARPAQIFYSLYFAMTGLHALHMIIGIPILLLLAWKAHRGAYGPAYHTPVEMTGLYWHFVDIVWIFLFPLLYLVGHH
ncbi:MAG TPA: cytochrome c oxidase subunit 3 family protein [Methylomirabilota bacterium]